MEPNQEGSITDRACRVVSSVGYGNITDEILGNARSCLLLRNVDADLLLLWAVQLLGNNVPICKLQTTVFTCTGKRPSTITKSLQRLQRAGFIEVRVNRSELRHEREGTHDNGGQKKRRGRSPFKFVAMTEIGIAEFKGFRSLILEPQQETSILIPEDL